MGIEEQSNFNQNYSTNDFTSFDRRKSDVNMGTKIAILEERMHNNEIVLNRLNDAVDLISKSSANIGKILAVHEEKLQGFERDEQIVSKIFDEHKKEDEVDHGTIFKRIEKIEIKLDEFAKFRWMVGGIATILALLTTVVSGNYIHIDHIEKHSSKFPSQIERLQPQSFHSENLDK